MPVSDLIDLARAAAAQPDVDPADHGLVRLSGGMTHDVFASADDSNLVVKVFRTAEREQPEREWDALVALAGSGVAPEPVDVDTGDPPVVAMTRVLGSPLPADALGPEHARVIGTTHRLVHRATPESRRPLTHSGIHAAAVALRDDAEDRLSQPHHASDVVGRAWSAARRWMAHADLERLLSSDALRFSRGDPNLTNYLWTGDGVVLVDWEDSGYNDPVLEFADMAEHASTHTLSDAFWSELADALELTKADRARVAHARQLLACFWLVSIQQRQRQGLPTTLSVEEQARRTLAALDR